MRIDDTSRRILEILQRDGRCPNTVIGRAVGISEAAVRARIHALTEAGVLQIVGLTDPSNMGFGVIAMIGVQANSDLNRIAEQVGGVDRLSLQMTNPLLAHEDLLRGIELLGTEVAPRVAGS